MEIIIKVIILTTLLIICCWIIGDKINMLILKEWEKEKQKNQQLISFCQLEVNKVQDLLNIILFIQKQLQLIDDKKPKKECLQLIIQLNGWLEEVMDVVDRMEEVKKWDT